MCVGAVHCRGGFFTHYTAWFTRCNFLHRSISWPIRCQGAGLRPASPCIVCLTKWALCGRGSRGAIITLPTLATTASSPWLRREQERCGDMIDDSTPPPSTDTDTSISNVRNHACLDLNSVISRGSLDITMPMLMVNLDCSDSHAAASTSILCPIHKRSSSREGSQVSRGWLCGTTTSKSSASAAVTQARPCRLRGRHTTLVPTSSKQGNDKGGADRCMFDNNSQLLPTTTTAAGAGTSLTGRGWLF